jgi:hypothetical protein
MPLFCCWILRLINNVPVLAIPGVLARGATYTNFAATRKLTHRLPEISLKVGVTVLKVILIYQVVGGKFT